MRSSKMKRRIAAAMTLAMAAMLSAPSLAGASASGLPDLKEDFVKRNITGLDGMDARISSPSDEAAGAGEADGGRQTEGQNPAVKLTYTIDGKEFVDDREILDREKETDHISFYVRRDPETNNTILPPPVTLKITQTEGDTAAGAVIFQVGDEADPDAPLRDKLHIVQSKGGAVLYPGESHEYKIQFYASEEMEEGKENINNDENQFIKVIVVGEGGIYEKSIPTYYGIDGLYSYYSAESTDRYEGALFTDRETGMAYRVVGQVDLNATEPPLLTVRHQFGVFDEMTGTDEEGNTVALWLSKARLNPDGYFTFPDGSTEMALTVEPDGRVSIPLQVKADVFSEWRWDAIRANKNKASHILLTDLLIEYNDGYWAGGNVNPLPLVFKVTYTVSSGSSGGSGGGGGGGGGGGSSSGTTSTGTIEGGPSAAPRVTKASSDDIGWVQQDGVWYYMDASNKPVTDWLLGPDGRWYFLDRTGAMKTGWLTLGGVWYFLNADGAMATGWVQHTDGTWYYLQQDGKMAVDMTTPDGYYVDKDGVWVKA